MLEMMVPLKIPSNSGGSLRTLIIFLKNSTDPFGIILKGIKEHQEFDKSPKETNYIP